MGIKEEIEADLGSPIVKALDSEGIDYSYLAKKLKAELNAKETKAQVPKGSKEFVYSKKMIAWEIRQKARQDAHKLRGDYPAEKHEMKHSGGVEMIRTPEEREEIRQIAKQIALMRREKSGPGRKGD